MSNLIGSSNNETNFPHKLLLTDTQISKIRKTFANGSSAFKIFKNFFIVFLIHLLIQLKRKKKKELSKKVTLNDIMKTASDSNFIFDSLKHISRDSSKETSGAGITLTNNEIKDIMKVIKSLENRGILLKAIARKVTCQEGGFLNFLKPLMTAGLPLMKNVLSPLAKNGLLPFGLSAGMSAADAATQKKHINGSGTTALITSNEEMEDIIKIVKTLEESGLLVKGIIETVKNEIKEQQGEEFLPMILGTLAASLLGNVLTGRRVIRAGENFQCHLIV